jgi:hypothetical protein
MPLVALTWSVDTRLNSLNSDGTTQSTTMAMTPVHQIALYGSSSVVRR